MQVLIDAQMTPLQKSDGRDEKVTEQTTKPVKQKIFLMLQTH